MTSDDEAVRSAILATVCYIYCYNYIFVCKITAIWLLTLQRNMVHEYIYMQPNRTMQIQQLAQRLTSLTAK